MITSTANQQVKYIKGLQKKGKLRRQEDVFVAEGPKMVLETPQELCKSIFVSESFWESWQEKKQSRGYVMEPRVSEETVSDHVMEAMTDTTTPQGVLAVVRMPHYTLEEILAAKSAHLLLVEGIQDPGNLGTMFRTGEGAGVTGIIMHPKTVDLFHPKTVRSTMGSIYRVPFLVAEHWEQTLQQISEAGVILYAAHLQETQIYDTFNYSKDCGFLIGNEGNGLTEESTAMADHLLKIPMGGQLESLNAAMAAGILMYEVNRQRRGDERADLV
jgi:TrmH family RNA methyltransferase